MSGATGEEKGPEAPFPQGEAHFRAVFENLPAGMGIVDLTGKLIQCNPALEGILGYSASELEGMSFLAFTHPEDREKDMAFFQDLAAGKLSSYRREKRCVRKDGSLLWGNLSVCLITGEAGKPLFAVGLLEDITERKRAEEALKLFSAAVEEAPDGIQLVDLDGRILYSNKAVQDIYGFPPEELVGMPVGRMNADPSFAERVILPALLEKGRWEGEVMVRHCRGRDFPIWLSTSIVADVLGEPMAMVGVIRDVTERRRMEEQLRQSIREKETLIKEIHHRVKNNLSVVSSLLRLQSGRSKDRETRDLFEESRNRVLSMSLIHEKLYRSEDPVRVDVRDYIGSLARELFESYRTSEVALEINVPEDVFLDIDTMIPCGLILNELLANALKHAFPGGRRGRVSVGFARVEGGRLTLSVRDDGVGMPQGFAPGETGTLGMELVSSLLEQLDGAMDIRSGQGTEVRITFAEGRPDR
ncbi:MAG: PAS domain S-box protein [Nitrospirota bacterium]